MPQVSAEYTPYATAKVDSGAPTKPVHIDFPTVKISDSIGEALSSVGQRGYGALSSSMHMLGNSYDKLGKAFEGAGDELFKRAMGLQELENENVAKKAHLEYSKYIDDQRFEYDQKLGEAANGTVLKTKVAEWEAKRKEMSERIPVGARRQFDSFSQNSFVDMMRHASSHSAAQTRAVTVQTSEATMNNFMHKYMTTRDEGPEKEAHKEAVRRELYGTLGPALGLNKATTDEKWRELESKMLAGDLNEIGKINPTLAMEKLKDPAVREALDAKVWNHLEDVFTRTQIQIESRNISERIQTADPDGPLDRKRDEAKKVAEGISDNPLLHTAVDSAVQMLHQRHRQEVAQDIEQIKNRFEDLVWGYATPGGTKPTTLEDLFAAGGPGTKELWDSERTPSRVRHYIERMMTLNSKRDFPWTIEREMRFQELMGMAKGSEVPARKEFLDIDLSKEELPAGLLHRLFDIQREMRDGSKIESDIRVRHAIGLVPELPMELKPAGGKPALVNRFQGALYQALLEERQRKHPGEMNDEEIKTVVYRVYETIEKNWLSRNRAFFDIMRVPDEKALQEIRDANPGLTEPEYLNLYSRAIYAEKFHSTIYKKPKEEEGPPGEARRDPRIKRTVRSSDIPKGGLDYPPPPPLDLPK